MTRFRLKYDPAFGSTSGSAWIMVGDIEITHDCGLPSELDRAVEDLKRELDALCKDARGKFAAQARMRAKEREA